MKLKTRLLLVTALFVFFTAAPLLFAQGTAFTYQGRLGSSNTPANGTYDFTFGLFNASTGGVQTGSTITDLAVPVTNGLFTVTNDFGAVFNGATFWLQIGVRTNGGGAFTALSPRQQLTPTPYAITAENVNGSVSGNALSGIYSNALTLSNLANTLSGNGSGLTSLNASALAAGTVPDARLSANVALLNASQTFSKTNVFTSGGGGAGRLIISNNFAGGVDTNLFTGLSLQYDASSGEAALMSSYNNGIAYLSFYTKAGSAYPVTKQMSVDYFGVLDLDPNNNNNAVLNNGTLAGVGLTFGTSSGEGIASKRTPGGNQYGLDFYTAFLNRMTILNNGFVGINRLSSISGNDLFTVRHPTTNGLGGMNVETAGLKGAPFYGYAQAGIIPAYTYLDGSDSNKWKLFNSGNHLTVTSDAKIGINTTTPSETLEINGTTTVDNNDIYLRSAGDHNHGLGYRQTITNNNLYIDGPFLYGYNGGALGFSGPDTAVLTWNYTGAVDIYSNLAVHGTASKPGGGSWTASSDARLKKNIHPLEGSLQKLLALRGVTFEYKEPEKIHELPGQRIGMIAQDVEKVFPDWVDTGDNGFKRLTYRGFEALTVEALRELRAESDQKINGLQHQLAAQKEINQRLEARMAALEQTFTRLSDKSSKPLLADQNDREK